MIQPRSVTQCRTSPRCRSTWYATSSAIFTVKPPWTWTTPFGRPVVPLVYARNSGCSASSSRRGHRGAVAGELVPARRRDLRTTARRRRPAAAGRRRDGRIRSPTRPRRRSPSSGPAALAARPVDREEHGRTRVGSREATASGPNPLKIGTQIAPSFATAITAATVSGSIGMKMPTASPLADAERREAAREPVGLAAQLGVGHHPRLAVLALPADGDRVRRRSAHRSTQTHARFVRAPDEPAGPGRSVAHVEHPLVGRHPRDARGRRRRRPRTTRCRRRSAGANSS